MNALTSAVNNMPNSQKELTLTLPHQLKAQFPLAHKLAQQIAEQRQTIEDILDGTDPRLMVIVGPCSIHDPIAVLEYAQKLQQLQNQVADQIFLVMRAYIEKPRTTIGWKGFLYDPDLDGSAHIQLGLEKSRDLYLKLIALGLPIASEILNPMVTAYFDDLLAWGAIGARTSESQIHREISSYMPYSLGFKNGTDGSIQIALDAIKSATHAHQFIGMGQSGLPCILESTGNRKAHLILRGANEGSNYQAAEIEKIKLEDGVRLHENTKAELLTYARENGVPTVKPFMLVIARDTTHAAQLLNFLESPAFYQGRYAGKVIQVDSSKTGKEEEEMIARLLAVESVNEPTEIVIHVNMLKEGWDVTNLYTIVPLRAANARTLIEQSIGRGLRLPYGKRTGVEAVDRLNIVAHDRFQEIIDEANSGNSILRLEQVILDAPNADDSKISVQVSSNIESRLGLSESSVALPTDSSPKPLFTTAVQKQVAQVVMEVAAQYETRTADAPTSQALLQPQVQAQIAAEVQKRLQSQQGELPMEAAPDVADIVAKTTAVLVEQTIDIPRIIVVPSGEISSGFYPFTLGELPNFQPGQREIIGQNLSQDNRQFSLSRESGVREPHLENYIVKKLVDFEDIDYLTQADLLYGLAGQAVGHYQAQNYSQDELYEIIDTYSGELARLIHAQMAEHFWEKASAYEAQVSRGFTKLKPCNYTAAADGKIHSVRETVQEVGRIKQMLFGGFERCLYPLQKFDSDTERRFAVILERDAEKWFKPAKGQFQIYYQLGTQQHEYLPDFVVETDNEILMVEIKARSDLSSVEVQAKATAAATWCQHASDYTMQHKGKPWRYLLIPHDEVNESKRLADFLRFEQKAV